SSRLGTIVVAVFLLASSGSVGATTPPPSPWAVYGHGFQQTFLARFVGPADPHPPPPSKLRAKNTTPNNRSPPRPPGPGRRVCRMGDPCRRSYLLAEQARSRRETLLGGIRHGRILLHRRSRQRPQQI